MSDSVALSSGILSLADSGEQEPPQGAVPLTSLNAGQQAKVAWVHSNHPFATRFRDLGFAPGSDLRVRIKAPFRGPVEYEVRGSRFCLRYKDAESIYVHLEPNPA